MVNFATYRADFENCIAREVTAGRLGKIERVTLKPNMLATSSFGHAMGEYVPSHTPFIIDYYGYMKRSIGQEEAIVKAMNQSPPPRFITTTVVHFAALRMQNLVYVIPHHLLAAFVEFKNIIIATRHF